MGNLLKKEMKLSASCLSYLFIAFGLMFLLPGYPILCGVFFVTLGIFQSFQNARETGDILFSALLPVAKRDVVKAKFLFVCLIEACALVLMAAATALRMTVLLNAEVYTNNALMNANPFALGMAFVLFGMFNLVFVGGFFKTAYRFAKPFVCYLVTAFLMIGVCETLHYLPSLDGLNAFGTEHIGLQLSLLAAGIGAAALLTWAAVRLSVKRFERIDL